VAIAGDGSFAVAWESFTQDGSDQGIFAQRFTSSGAKSGAERQVNATTQGIQNQAAVAIGDLAVVTSGDRAFVLTIDGELVEQLDVSPLLPGAIERLGRLGDRAVISSTGRNFRSDSDLSGFEAWSGSDGDDVAWSRASPLPAPLLISLQDQYRGRGLTIERLLSDIHSGRIVGTVAPLLMDLVALLLIVLSLTGLTMWMRASRPGNGS
jgi:hypothetical protein